jgi:peptidoglycan/LPS O-acetylase OafA/YrhL
MLTGFALAHAYGQRLGDGFGKARAATADFYAGRIARIWPLHLVCALVALLLSNPVWDWRDVAVMLAQFTLLQSWLPATVLTLNSPAWTLSVDLFFYALFPLLLPATRRLSRGAAALALPIVLVAIAAWDWSQDGAVMMVFFAPPARLGEFGAGLLLHRLIAHHHWRPTLPGVALLLELAALSALPAVALAVEMLPPSQRSVGALVPAVLPLVVVFYLSRGPVARLLSLAPVVYLGRLSFALYMVHMLVPWALDRLGAPSMPWPALLVLSLMAAALLHHLVEQPAQAALRPVLGRMLRRWPLGARAGGREKKEVLSRSV